MNYSYTPSKLLPGEGEFLRHHGFTRWMSRDLLQPASDFLKNLRLLAIYVECSSEDLHRYLCWHPPKGCAFEIRSGRTLEQFEEFDRGNLARGCHSSPFTSTNARFIRSVGFARPLRKRQESPRRLWNHARDPDTCFLSSFPLSENPVSCSSFGAHGHYRRNGRDVSLDAICLRLYPQVLSPRPRPFAARHGTQAR